MQLLTQNSKMKKSSKNGITVVNWTIPAFQSSSGLKTCPNASLCSKGCYARSETYRFSRSIAAHEAKLALTQSDSFVGLMITEIESWLNKRSTKQLAIRIHDAGDFYSQAYLSKWIRIMTYFENDVNVSFYAYTKQIKMIKSQVFLPNNFTAIFSFGGKQDLMININKDRHARVFESIGELMLAGYIDGSSDDLIAARGISNKIGLVYHGVKSYQNTTWDKVA